MNSKRPIAFGANSVAAHRSDILQIVMRQAMLLALVGIVAGLCAALALIRYLQYVLYKTGSHDRATFILSPLLLLCVAAIASYLPPGAP
jgi:putative ABC transport system permease protein